MIEKDLFTHTYISDEWPLAKILQIGNKHVQLIGITHTRDKNDPTISLIEKSLHEFMPELLILEGYPYLRDLKYKKDKSKNSLLHLSHDEIIAKYGEIEFAHSIASELTSVKKITSAEPTFIEEFEYLSNTFDKVDVIAFLVVRYIEFYEKVNISTDIKTDLERVFKKIGEKLDSSKTKIKNQFAKFLLNRSISSAETQTLVPLINPFTDSEDVLTHICQESVLFRDNLVVKTVLSSKYKKITAIFGWGHLLRVKEFLMDFVSQSQPSTIKSQ